MTNTTRPGVVTILPGNVEDLTWEPTGDSREGEGRAPGSSSRWPVREKAMA